MLRSLFFWGLSYCILPGAIEFSVGKYTVRDYEVYSELEFLSKKGELSGGIIRQTVGDAKMLVPPLSRGFVSSFGIIPNNHRPMLHINVIPQKPINNLIGPELEESSCIFDFKDKKITGNKFKKADFSVISSARPREKEVREVVIKEYLCAGDDLTCWGWSSNPKESWKRFVEAFTFFTIGINVKGCCCTFTFDKSEKRELEFVKRCFDLSGSLRMLHSWKEAVGEDEFLLELRQMMWKDSRRVFRFAVKKSVLSDEIKKKYPHLSN